MPYSIENIWQMQGIIPFLCLVEKLFVNRERMSKKRNITEWHENTFMVMCCVKIFGQKNIIFFLFI